MVPNEQGPARSLHGGQNAPGDQTGGHEHNAEGCLRPGESREPDGAHRCGNQEARYECRSRSHEKRHEQGDCPRPRVRHRCESDAPEDHPADVSSHSDGQRHELRGISRAESSNDLGAERHKGSGPVAVANAEPDHRAGGGGCRYEPGLDASLYAR